MSVTATRADAVWFVDNLAYVRIHGDDTKGRLALVEGHAHQGHMPPLHVHRREDETFVVLDGRITAYAGDRIVELEAGATAFLPKGVPHTFRVESETANWLVVATPAGFERFVLAAGRRADEEIVPSEPVLPEGRDLAEIAADFGIELLGPPGALPS